MHPTSNGNAGTRSLDRGTLLALSPADRMRDISAYLRDCHRRITGRDAPDDLDTSVFLESLQATELQITIDAELNVSVPLTDLVAMPSLRVLAEAVDHALLSASEEPLAETERELTLRPDVAGWGEPFGLTDVQHAYWLGRSGLFELGDVSTHVYLELESSDFDPVRASVVLGRLVGRHGMLRGVVRGDGRQQVLGEVGVVEVGFEDLSGLSVGEVEGAVAVVRERLSHEVRPAGEWPLFEVCAQRLPGGVTRVHVSVDMLVADAASVRILLSEWGELYADPECELPPIDVSFRDYVLAVASGSEDVRAREYWLSRLDTLPAAPELPLVSRAPGGPTRFVRRTHQVADDRWRSLKRAAQARGVTASALLCAAYAEALALWAKEPRFTLNVTIGDRLPLHPHVDRLIGDFTNLVLLEVDTESADTFVARAGNVQRRLWEDLEHRGYGGVLLLRELARRHGPESAAMPVVFTSVLGRDMPGGSPADPLPGLGHVVSAVSQTPQVTLDCQVVEVADGLLVSWDAVEALFPEGVLDAAFASFVSLVESLADGEDTWESACPVEVPEAHAAVVAAVNATERPLPEGLLHEPFFERAALTPEAPAVIWSSGHLTYAELAGRAARVGQHLGELGVRPGERVVVSMRKGWEQVAAVLGVLRAGGVYVPVDPALPAERVGFLVEHTEARVVLTQPGLLGGPWPSGVPVAAVDDTEVEPQHGHTGERTRTDLAYVIFTSGSTGVPKGVMIDHRGARNTLEDINERIGLAAGDRVLAVSSLSFDLSVWDVFGTLAAGAALVVPDAGSDRDPAHWSELVDRHGVTVWNSVPALFELFTEYRAASGPRAGLRCAMLSGDWIPLSLPERAWGVFPGVRLLSLGGATEASVWSIHHPITEVAPGWSSIPYGTALANQSMYVLDGRMRTRPAYATGGIYIGGVGTALGYWKDAEKTAGSFVVHPRTGERLYRTGDLGRFWPDGTIEFLGREDQQVKINGYRIELGEIDAALTAHPQVADAVTITDSVGQGGKRLVSYVTSPLSVDTEELRVWLRSKIPAYMVPPVMVVLDEIPLSGNGKVDRKALPAPDQGDAAAVYTPPASPVEHALVEVWSELLNPAQPLSTGANLFELGADSLLALRATAAADRHGLRLQLADVFAHPTIAQQAPVVQAAGAVETALIEPDVAGWGEPFGLTDVQHAYWLGRSGLFELGDVSTHVYLELESSDFDPVRASVVLGRLVGRHGMLRGVVRGDGRQQVLGEVGVVEVGFEDLSGLSVGEVEGAVAVVRERLSHEVRPAGEWPLFEVCAQRLPGGVTRVHVSVDMLVADAASVRILLSEWGELYADPECELPPIDVSFRDYVLAVASGPEDVRAREYWLSRLDTLPAAPELPLVSRAPGGPTRFVRRTHTVSRERWTRLKDRAQARGVTASALLCAAYAEALALWAKEPRFTLNVTIGDRLPLHPHVDRLIGDFTNLVLLEADTAADGSFADRAQALQHQLFRDMEHRAFGGIRVIRELARAHGPARASMPVVFTSVLGHDMPGGDDGVLPGLGRLLGGVSQTPQVHLDCQVLEIAGELMISWDAVEALFPEGVLDAAFDAYTHLVETLADDEAVWARACPVEVPEAHAAVVAAVNATERPLPEGLLHEPFFERAALTPEAPAVIWSSGHLTYAELAGRAARVGQHLGELGVRPGERVVVSMRKGWEQVAAVLGVLRAGGVYVPVDPALPAERVGFLVEHTEARVVLTQPGLLGGPWPSGVPVAAVDDTEVEPQHGHTGERTRTDLAYVIFTSGSTGVPKGVMIDHRGARNTLEDINERIGLAAGDRVLAVSSLSFDLSVWDVFGTLAAGAALVVPDAGSDRDPAHWSELVDRHGVTVWNSVPALFELFTEYRAASGPRAGLRCAMLSGDWIPLSLPERAWGVFPGVRLLSLGGATEASVWSIHHPITEVAPGWSSIPYGTALANQSMYVLDGRMRTRPAYATGGIYIGGVGTALGYWKDAEKTAGSFVVHPRTGERLYRTGDLGRFWPDGTIEFLGREDQQVKINGYRIELGEIDAALTAHPQIADAVTVTDAAGQGGKRLVSYVTLHADVKTDELREWLRSKIPAYMVPPVMVVLDEFPLSGNGKVDRKALPAPDQGDAAAVYTPPASPVEHALVEVWSELLNPAQPLSTGANLFELGADSLLALRATAAADRHGLHLQLADVFAHPTIAQQALAADSVSVGPTDDDPVGPTGMTPSQHWFLSQDLPRRQHWNDASFLLALQRPLDPAVLARALDRVLGHHDALRLRFSRSADGGWAAQVAPHGGAEDLPFTVHDLSHLDSRAQKKQSVEISDRLQASLDLGHGPLLRMAYFDMGDRPHCVLFLAHWLAVDHYSGRIVLEDLLGCYADLEAGGEGLLPPRTTSFRAWTRGLATYANGDEVTAEVAHWASDARRDATLVPVDGTEGPNSLESLENVTVRVDRKVTEALVHLLPRHLRADLSEVLCSAALRALHTTYPKLGGTARTLIDLERHGRDLPVPGANVSRTVGRFSTLVPVLFAYDPALPADEALRRVRDQVDAQPARGAGHGLLTYLSKRPEAVALRGLPAASIGVNYLGQVDEVFLRSDLLSVPRMAYGSQRSDVGTRFRLIDVIGFVVAGRLNLTVGFSANRHDAASREAFTAALVGELTELAAWVSGLED